MIRNTRKKHIHTTLSDRHFSLLKKYTEKFGTHQKVLEFALESLENDTNRNSTQLSDDRVWVVTGRGAESASVLHNDAFKVLLEGADVKQIIKIMKNQKMAEHMIAWYYQKPLKKCSMKEVVEGAIFFLKASKIFDTVNYIDGDNYYILKMIHDLHIGTSRMFSMWIATMFEAYGLKTESEISEKSLFMKIYMK